MKAPITRRAFLTQVSAAGLAAPFIFPRLSFAKPPSGKLQHAAIGVGGQGASDLENIASSDKVKVYALCDIDENTLRKASQKYPGARLYRDWREMLHKEKGHIDSVNVSTPDHTHAPASMTAIRRGPATGGFPPASPGCLYFGGMVYFPLSRASAASAAAPITIASSPRKVGTIFTIPAGSSNANFFTVLLIDSKRRSPAISIPPPIITRDGFKRSIM